MRFKEYLKENDMAKEMSLQMSLKQQPSKRKRIFQKYMVSGNSFKPVGEVVTEKTIPSGVYKIVRDISGILFEIHDVNTDEILRFEDVRYNKILKEIDNFWNLKEDFKKYGFSHKRGVLLYGDPGSGKSALLKLAMEDAVNSGHVVLITSKDPHSLVEGLKSLREVESERKILVIMEDIDEIIRYNEHAILELFDGDSQMDNVLFLATTNYIDRLPPRILRASRFDRKIQIGNPPADGRYAYLRTKLKEHVDGEKIHDLVEKTKGFTFAQLKEFVVSCFCLKNDEDEVVERIKNNLEGYSIHEGYLNYLGEKLL